ncbi:hypothetical protein BDR05DRAFT_950964 [Suillus weaverae]|nr:hypothetical protein BDR05DRAFT_950964 [Suillus weaverae]
MDSHLSMSVDIDIDMQHPDIQPEDIQTSHNADLFKDDEDEDDDESSAGHFTDALTHPPTSISQPPTMPIQVSEKRRFHEGDYSETLQKTVYEQEERINNIKREMEAIRQEAQDRIEEQQRLAEEEHERHMHDVNEKTQQWEAALKEQEQERQGIADDVKQLQEHEKAIFAEMERRLQLEVEKLRAAKENELTNMEQRFARSGRQQHAGTEMDMDQDPTQLKAASGMPQWPTIKNSHLFIIALVQFMVFHKCISLILASSSSSAAGDTVVGVLWFGFSTFYIECNISMSNDLHVFVHDGQVYTSLTALSLPNIIPYEPPWDPWEDYDRSPDDSETPLTTHWAYGTRPWFPLIPLNPSFNGPIFECLNHSWFSLLTEVDTQGKLYTDYDNLQSVFNQLPDPIR